MTDAIAAAIARAEADFPDTLARLKELVRIPSCSFPGFDHAHLERSAQACVDWLLAAGYPEARIARLPGVFPYVIAKDHRAGPGCPTLLLYAHHDVQPPLREHLWRTPVFEPTERDGRLYARGAADDKAGIAIHCASAAAWNAVAGRPPVNLTVVIEGEEEIGSEHFSRFLDAHLSELQADCLVIADAANFDTGLPSLTTSLRGLVGVEVELKALRAPLHSGMWGGTVPDAVQALCRLIASLSDARGDIAIPGIYERVRALNAAETASYRRLPYAPERFAEQAGLLASPGNPDVVDVHRRMWRWPSLSVNAIQAGTRGQTGNVVMDSAWARLGIRIVPDMQAEEVYAALAAHLRAHAPAGMELTITRLGASTPWGSPTDHPVFARAAAALERGFGVAPVFIGCGGSIPFVGEMTAKLGGIPALLTGVEDPTCGAHAENESLHLGDFRSALKAQVALFGLLSDGLGGVRKSGLPDVR
ncbi:MAG: M20/M25/M40 family metallo-hydrolase [Planctomycetes bacterium]|nr:M20/M25/M40 family metallo-hydrolase [Planctomycetota bacterium]